MGKKSFKEKKTIGSHYSVDKLLKAIMQDQVFFEESGGGVTFSGGEPLMQGPFLTEIVKGCKNAGIHVALDTSGYGNNKLLKELIPFVDLFLYDIKHLNNTKHKEYTGADNSIILKNLETLLESQKETIIRYPLIPGVNNSPDDLELLNKLVKDRVDEIHFLPYHKIANHKYIQLKYANKMNGTNELSYEEIKEVETHFQQLGYTVKIGG